jgi:TIR domain
MPILTRAEFESVAKAKSGTSFLKGVVNETRNFSKSASVTSIFLCHAHTEKSIVEQAKLFFENLGISIYVDWEDQSMPEKPDGTTAINIKNQIISKNEKFVVLATNNAIASKWCNWEIGIADPFKNPDKKMALLPIADNNKTWNGNEYLQIYPRIELSAVFTGEYVVWYPNGTNESLKAWITRK